MKVATIERVSPIWSGWEWWLDQIVFMKSALFDRKTNVIICRIARMCAGDSTGSPIARRSRSIFGRFRSWKRSRATHARCFSRLWRDQFPLAGHRVPAVGPSDIFDMTDNTMVLICRAVKRVKRCPRRWRRWMVATSDTETLSLSYRISRASCGTARPWTVVPIVPRTPPPHRPASRGNSPLSFSLRFADLRPGCDLNRSIEPDRYAGVGDRSQSAIRLPCERSLTFFYLGKNFRHPVWNRDLWNL